MKYTLMLLVIAFFASCSLEENNNTPSPFIVDVDYDALNEQEITEYLANNNLKAEKSESGLYYVIQEEGTGEQPDSSSNVTVTYKGYLTSGRVFDEQAGDGIDFNLQRLIPGFSEGITLLREGGKAKLIIPSRLAYRNSGVGSIPPGAVLIFDIGLVSVN